MKSDQDNLDQSEDIKVFSSVQMTWGVPSKLFFGGVALGLMLGVAMMQPLGWVLAVIFTTSLVSIILVVLMALHKNDPQGLEAWVRRLQNPATAWGAGKYKKKRIVAIR
ncbi:hypothetical protein WH95_19600 [Kiloniella litopenaei]|uniref:Uncharacterized protein n=1 Tax=Kiloniella litopenaei TaxID=1549748 RepID=A0A0M2R0S8_9PROT|nr:hypothetical protein [Kiloniella litopenaei]KKJ75226.1 hypothetical protein WH95_19600 [Kiloniella litopenaei]